VLEQALAAYNQSSATSYHLRSREQMAAFFDKLAVVPPGLVSASWWRPGPQDTRQDASACGVALKQ
jgi:hypothetical protein